MQQAMYLRKTYIKYSAEERSYYALNTAVTADNYKDFTDSTVVWKPVSNQLGCIYKHPTKGMVKYLQRF